MLRRRPRSREEDGEQVERRGGAKLFCGSASEAQTGCLTMATGQRIVYRLPQQPPLPTHHPLHTSVSSHRVRPLLKATRVRLGITSLLKDTFNYAPLSRDHFFRELCVSLACALRNGTSRSTCCFLPPIKGHVDRLGLLLVCAPLTHLGKMMNMERGGEEGGDLKRERNRKRG